MNLFLRLSLILIVFCLSDVAHANCSTPNAALGGLDLATQPPRYCDGSTWQSFNSAASFPLLAPAGTVTAPIYTFADGTTGMYRSGISQIAFANAGTMSMIFFAANVGLGVAAPVLKLEVAGGMRVGSDVSSCTTTKEGTIRYTSGKLEVCDGSLWRTIQSSAAALGSILYSSPGTLTWTVPTGVTRVSVVAIGGGGGGATQASGNGGGGGGGALCYSNNYAVTPGGTITVVVGAGGAKDVNGSDSIFDAVVSAGGGMKGSTTAGGSGGTGSTVGGSCYNGGAGGSFTGTGTNFAAGGGGAGGYAGVGGQGGNSSGNNTPSNQTAGGGGGGGGGGGASSPTNTSSGNGTGGGGTGPYGQGSNGAAGSSSTDNAGHGQTGGGGGSMGAIGGPSEPDQGNGGGCGGGGGGRNTYSTTGGRGGDGCVRIIWGGDRTFPSNAN